MNKIERIFKKPGHPRELYTEQNVVLQCKGLAKRFVDGPLRVEVLTGVDLTIKKGESIAIIGTSGSGKSTLLHLLGGLDKPTGGKVIVTGVDMSLINEEMRGYVRNDALGFVYQFHHLMPEFTALENVAMPLLIRGIDAREARKNAAEMLTQVGLEQRIRHKPSEMSGGERQRAAIARALVTRPKCLLADEPTGNLDRKTAEHVFDRMLELNRDAGTGIVIVTHDERIAEKMQRVYVLEDGVLKG